MSIQVRYCSNPGGHAPKDCPDYPKDEDERRYYEANIADVQENLANTGVEVDKDEVEEMVHSGRIWELS